MTMTKKALIAGAFLTAAGIAGTATAGAPVIYGKANISVQSNSVKGAEEDNVTVNSNASRFGVKGKHKLTNGLSAFYKLEYEVSMDGTDDEFSHRNIYAGVKGGFGAVQAGRFDTPVKKAQGKIDLFNDLDLGDIKNVTDIVYDADDRVNNAIQYTSPKIADSIKVKVAVIAGEENKEDDGDEARDSVADGVQASVTYKAGNLYAALAFGSDHERNDEDVMRAAVQYEVVEGTKLGLIYQTAEGLNADLNDNDTRDAGDLGESDAIVFSASHKIGANTVKFQYGTADVEFKGGDKILDRTVINLGVDHKLNKKTKVFAYYASAEDDFVGGDKDEESTIGLGMEVKF